MSEAIKAGSDPVMKGAFTLAKTAADRLKAEGRLEVTEAMLASLTDEAGQAQRAVAAAKLAVDAAARVVLLAEAEEIAVEVKAAEERAMTLRAELVAIDSVGFSRGPTSPAIAEVMEGTIGHPGWARNEKGFNAAQAARPFWVSFKAALESDASASLRFA